MILKLRLSHILLAICFAGLIYTVSIGGNWVWPASALMITWLMNLQAKANVHLREDLNRAVALLELAALTMKIKADVLSKEEAEVSGVKGPWS